ncbi:hypothetical protein G6F56_006947 [Rhizopus delemar]|nr:hypothetical protein G6F56_006947 [Rhizopus delemar]
MGRKSQKSINAKLQRSSSGRFEKKKKNDAPIVEEPVKPTGPIGFEVEENDGIIHEWQALNVREEVLTNAWKSVICWKEGAREDIKIRKRHMGNGRSSMYSKRHKTIQKNTLRNYFEASNEVRKQEIEEPRSHHVFDNDVIVEVEGLDLVKLENEESIEEISEALPRLREYLKTLKRLPGSQVMGPKSKFNLEAYNVYRYQSVEDYFFQRIEKDKKPRPAALHAASRLWPGGNQRYYSDVIRFWTKEFISNNRLPDFRQGQHAKSESILADKDVASFVKKYILETKASLRSLSTMSRHINLNIVPEFMNNQLGTVSPSTLSKYLKLWGLTFKIRGKSIYYDGHE